MPGDQGQQLLPQVHVQGGFFVAFDPALFLPAVHPALGQGVDDVFGVGVQLHHAGLLQAGQGPDDAGKLHAVVGGVRRAAGQLLFHAVPLQDGPPAPGSGIAGAGAVGIDQI